MRNRALIDPLEGRRLMTVGVWDGQPLPTPGGGTEPTSIDLSPEAVARDQLTVIQYPGGGFITGGAHHVTRVGVFQLPTLKADGSSRMNGSAGDDVIVIESVTGYAETFVDNLMTDGEFDFLSLVDPTTGARYVTTGLEISKLDDQINGQKAWLKGDEYELAAITWDASYVDREDERAERLAEINARIVEGKKQIARLEATKGIVDSGQFIKYTLGGVYDFYAQVYDGKPTFTKVTVDAGAGNDSVTISPNVPLKATIYGGSGADVITTGKKLTSVFGGGGKDRLISRSTKGATLDGGQGADRYFNKTTREIDVVGRNDGDTMVVAGGSFAISKMARVWNTPDAAGYFTVIAISDKSYDSAAPSRMIELVKPTP